MTIKIYNFPVSASSMLASYREHATELLSTTDFLDPSEGYRRIAHFSLLDDLLSYLYFLENGKQPQACSHQKIRERPEEFGPSNGFEIEKLAR